MINSCRRRTIHLRALKHGVDGYHLDAVVAKEEKLERYK